MMDIRLTPVFLRMKNRRATSYWVAVMSDGQMLTGEDYIRQQILDYKNGTLTLLYWIQDGVQFELNFVSGLMSVGVEYQQWPRKLDFFEFGPPDFIAAKQFSSQPSFPSLELVCVKLGMKINCGGYFVSMFLKIYPNGKWEWAEVQSEQPQIEVGCVSGVDYWKIYYAGGTIITARMMNWEDTPTDGVVIVLLFFKEPHPAAPRARLHGYDFYWKRGNTFGWSMNKPEFAHGNIKTGVWVSDAEWKWILMTSKRDYYANGYIDPSPQW